MYITGGTVLGAPGEDWSLAPPGTPETADMNDFMNEQWQTARASLMERPSWGEVSATQLRRSCALPPVSARPDPEPRVTYRLDIEALTEPSGLPYIPPPEAIQDVPPAWDLVLNVPFFCVTVSTDGVVYRVPAEWHLWFGLWLSDRSGCRADWRLPLLPWEKQLQLRSVSSSFACILGRSPWPISLAYLLGLSPWPISLAYFLDLFPWPISLAYFLDLFLRSRSLQFPKLVWAMLSVLFFPGHTSQLLTRIDNVSCESTIFVRTRLEVAYCKWLSLILPISVIFRPHMSSLPQGISNAWLAASCTIVETVILLPVPLSSSWPAKISKRSFMIGGIE
jgi:hypothetical protein